MDEPDAYPTRDIDYYGPKPYQDDALVKRTTAQKQQISKWAREELEDRYLRLYEENLVLKKHARKQEEKIKRMATKLLRLVSDKRKSESVGNKQTSGNKKGGRDIETEEMLEDLHSKISQLENHNQQLKEKLMVTKQQLATTGQRKSNTYGHVQSRIQTGIQKAPADPRLTKQMRVTGPPANRGHSSPTYQRYGHGQLDKQRQENRRLELQIDSLNDQIGVYMQEAEMLKEQMQMREAEYEEDMLKIKQQMSQGQRSTIQENIDIIRLQREVKEKSSKLTQLQSQYANLEDKLRTVKNSHDSVLIEMEGLNDQLKLEQNRVIALQNENKSGTTSKRVLMELEERCKSLEEECAILKEANEKLVASAFDLEREREWKQREHALKVQIAQLEATMKNEVGAKGSVLDKWNSTLAEQDKLEEELKEFRLKYFQTKQENDELRDKVRFFTKESAVDFQEIEEALMIVKKRKERETQDLDFLTKVDDEKDKDADKVIRNLRAENADTANELEKTRNMLIVQHKINKEYQQEASAVTAKMEEMRKEYDTKLDEYAALLDIRANRIKKLEAQLRDVAYGTRQYRIQPLEGEEVGSEDEDNMEETIHLERGQNLFEIHVKRLVLSSDAIRELGDEEPQLFGTWEFYEHEVHATPVMRGPRPEYDFRSQYIVKVDDFFLHYLQKDSCTFELHQSFGTDYRTVAACQLKMRDILDKPQGRMHATVQLVGVLNGVPGGTNYGMLEYWVRLKVPMEQALRLYKERTKALGYIESNVHTAQQALQAMDEEATRRPPDNINQISIKVIRCNDVQARREGIQPSPYVVYKFFDYADHVTTTIPGSNDPQFNDHQIYNVPMAADLDKYLKTQSLSLFVFDDTDPEQASFLGCAKVSLIYLAHDKPIKASFELFSPEGSKNGTVDVSIKWKYNYIPPKAGTRTTAQMQASGLEVPEPVPLLPGEEDALKESVVAGGPSAITTPKAPKTPRSKGRSPRKGPTAESTPGKQRREPPEKEDWIQDNISAIEKQIIVDQEAAPPLQSPKQERQRHTPRHKDRMMSQVSEVSEGTPVSGEDESISELSEDSTPRGLGQPMSVETPKSLPQLGRSTSSVNTSLSETLSQQTGVRRPVPTPRSSLHKQKKHKPVYLRGTWPQSPTHQASHTLQHQDPGYTLDDKTPEELIAEELGETSRSSKPMSDTMFEEARDHDSAEEERDSARSRRTVTSDTDSDVVCPSPNSRPGSQLISLPDYDTVTVAINHLRLENECELRDNDAVDKLFVEYRFLGVPSEETECPYALPKPGRGKEIHFNFTKIFQVDFDQHYERRQFLASMLLPDDPEDGKIKFTVVSEPNDEEGECEDVGRAYVSIKSIMDSNRDLVEADVDIVDISDDVTVVGQLNVTVKCLQALKAVQMEMTGNTINLQPA